jgi:protein-L-isoaspartate(D-aspartate) O-methyltransferase
MSNKKKEENMEEKVLSAVSNLPRELFVPEEFKKMANLDIPLPIDCDQTISQPYVVSYMTSKLDLKTTDRVLEIGTGSGFQAAVFAQLVKEVFSIEIFEELSLKAEKIISYLGYKNVNFKIGDGKKG